MLRALLLSAAMGALLLARVEREASGRLSAISLPDGSAGIGFDDLRYSARLRRVLVPAGRIGSLALVDPATRNLTVVPGFSRIGKWSGGHDESVTSADEGEGLVFATDRTSRELLIVDPRRRAILSRAPLGASPDYVRWIDATREVWVTEPDAERIEVFRFSDGSTPAVTSTGAISVPGGPESLVVDEGRKRAFTHLWAGRTVAIDLASHSIRDRWGNGCSGSRGIALDPKRGFLFVGCAEGRTTVLDAAHDGRILGSLRVGAGVDVIDSDPVLGHVYVPSGKTSTLSVLAVSPAGELRLLGTLPTASGAHCAVTDRRGSVYVCDPKGGRLLVFRDLFPPAQH